MNVIYKFKLDSDRRVNVLQVSKYYKILDIKVINNEIYVWILMHKNQPKVDVVFKMFPTGEAFNYTNRAHVKTVRVLNEIWHIFEEFETRIDIVG